MDKSDLCLLENSWHYKEKFLSTLLPCMSSLLPEELCCLSTTSMNPISRLPYTKSKEPTRRLYLSTDMWQSFTSIIPNTRAEYCEASGLLNLCCMEPNMRLLHANLMRFMWTVEAPLALGSLSPSWGPWPCPGPLRPAPQCHQLYPPHISNFTVTNSRWAEGVRISSQICSFAGLLSWICCGCGKLKQNLTL